MPIKRARLIVSGDVMGVRYRDYVQKTGLLHGLKGSVENKPDRTVEIICEGENEQVERFINEIKGGEKKGRGEIDRYPLLDVQGVDVYLEETPTNKFTMFDIKYGGMAEEVGDQICASYGVLLDYDQHIKKLDSKYGEISVNINQSSEAIKILADAVTTFQDALMDDREAIKELTTGIKDLVNEVKNYRPTS